MFCQIRNTTTHRVGIFFGLILLTGLQGCNHIRHKTHAARNSIVGAQAVIGGHKIMVEPCFGIGQKVETVRDAPNDSMHRIKCKHDEVVVENDELRVNGKSYGKITPSELREGGKDYGKPVPQLDVFVSKGRVYINDREIQPLTQVAQN